MINTKETLKQFGEKLQSSNQTHQSTLRARLARSIPNTAPIRGIPFKHILFLGGWAMAAVAIILVTRPNTFQNLNSHPNFVANQPEATSAPTNNRVIANPPTTDSSGFGSIDTGNKDIILTGSADFYNLTETSASNSDVVDYAQKHGQMLDTSTNIDVLTTEHDLSTKVSTLFDAFGGHINNIYSDNVSNQNIVGLIPTNGYFQFKEQLRDLAKADRYFSEILNAHDLAPSAVTLNKHIDELTQSIDAIQKQIDDSKDANAKLSLEKKLASLKLQRDNLHKSKNSLDDQVAYTEVSISITETPSFLKARTINDFRLLVAGFKAPGVFQQMWINVLIVTAYSLQLFSVTFWLIFPLSIWLLMKRKERKAWRELA